MQKKLYFCSQNNDFFVIFTNMKKKNNWKNTKWGIIAINLLAACCVAIALLIATIIYLRQYTLHGKEIQVPELTNLYIEEARIIAQAEGLNISVIDSTFSSKVPLGTIVEQIPKPGAKVKKDRNIYLIQNARIRRPVILPNLIDLSVRQAEATLKTLGLTVQETIYKPSMYKNIILEVQHQGQTIDPGQQLQEGNALTLIVGKGQGTAKVPVPQLIGKTEADAVSWIRASQLTIGIIQHDTEPTPENKNQYIVFQQTPESGTIVVEGTEVSIQLSLNKEKIVTANYEESEEDFF